MYKDFSTRKWVFSPEETKYIIDSYSKGEKSCTALTKEFGIVDHHVILKVLHENSVNVDPRVFHRKYALNEYYFDSIDTPNKAYILGFLFADGHNEIPKGTISMALQEEDREILEKIRKEIKSERPLEYIDYSNKHDFGYVYKNQYRLLLFSSHMCSELKDLGMIKNKSLYLELPNIPEHLYSHFIRGYFDGDGSITLKGLINFTSTSSLVHSIDNIIRQNLSIDSGIIRDASNKNGITKVLCYNKKADVKIILDWMYEGAELYLERKFLRYQNAFYNAA